MEVSQQIGCRCRLGINCSRFIQSQWFYALADFQGYEKMIISSRYLIKFGLNKSGRPLDGSKRALSYFMIFLFLPPRLHSS